MIPFTERELRLHLLACLAYRSAAIGIDLFEDCYKIGMIRAKSLTF
jgi:hypothetical protein